MKIVVASDLTSQAERALARAALLAQPGHGEVHVVHVVDAALPHDLQGPALEWARTALDQALRQLEGVAASSEVLVGKIRPILLQQIKSQNADVLVMGCRVPREADAPPFIETTAGHVLRESPRPALVVCDAPRQSYRHVVIGVDFSPHSRVALRHAVRLAPEASFTLVHAYDNPFDASSDAAELDSVDYGRRLDFEAFMAGEMELLVRSLVEAGIAPEAIETEVSEGKPATVLGEACQRVQAELLIIGTHGRTSLFRALWGSVAAEILNQPPCDILVVKTP